MERGIALPEDDVVRKAFQLANSAMAESARRRDAQRTADVDDDALPM